MMKSTAILILVVLLSVQACTTPQCGCFMSKTKQQSFDCSNQSNIDFECLSENEPIEINLSNNNYTEFPFELFALNFQRLQFIDISLNSIAHVPEEIVHYLDDLKFVNLSYNNLKDFNEIRAIKKKNFTLLIEHNPFVCNCGDSHIFEDNEHAKKLKTSIWCYCPITKNYLPLKSCCHEEFNSKAELKGNTGWVKILVVVLLCLLIGVIAWRVQSCQRNQTANSTR